MVDHELIQRKLMLLDENANQLKKLDLKLYESFKKQYTLQKATEKILQEMIETCLDIGKHIISDQGFRSPDDYKDVFTVLEEEGVIKKSTADIMKQMVGFRNLIVHLYEKIDVEIVFMSATKRLKDFNRFSKEILSYLNKGE